MSEPENHKKSPDPGKEGCPECFGDGERVCPEDEEGINQPQPDCLPCPVLRSCLQIVMAKRGKIRLVETPPSTKITGFLKRWSDQKLSEKKEK